MNEFKPYVCMQTNSRCYKNTSVATVVGVLWHSTGANNPNLKRYVQPADNSENYSADITKLGVNKSRNDWNHIQVNAGVNAWIGKFADGSIGTVQTMPWNYAPWGCGSGKRGSLNKINGKMWIQFEICEDALTDKDYAEKVYNEAVALTAYLCHEFRIDPNGTVKVNGVDVPTIICHNDASKLGFGTSHSDINHWFPKILNKDMAAVRRDVGAAMGDQENSAPVTTSSTETTTEITTPSDSNEYQVRVTAGALNIRPLPNTVKNPIGVVSKNEVYTIVEEKDGWGKLKSGKGWIMLKYTVRV